MTVSRDRQSKDVFDVIAFGVHLWCAIFREIMSNSKRKLSISEPQKGGKQPRYDQKFKHEYREYPGIVPSAMGSSFARFML